jgi:F-type H+-transporting ATPase subunit b
VLAAGMLGVVPAFAADAERSSGMPQFNLTSFPSQIFWLVVSFAVLYFMMAKMVLPRIGSIIETRERAILSDLEAAQKANDAARAAGVEQERTLTAARTEASGIIRQSAEAAAAQTTAKMHEIGDRLGAEIAAAERRIAEQRSSVLAGLEQMAGDIAQSVYDKLAGQPADAAALNARVAAALKGESR